MRAVGGRGSLYLLDGQCSHRSQPPVPFGIIHLLRRTVQTIRQISFTPALSARVRFSHVVLQNAMMHFANHMNIVKMGGTSKKIGVWDMGTRLASILFKRTKQLFPHTPFNRTIKVCIQLQSLLVYYIKQKKLV